MKSSSGEYYEKLDHVRALAAFMVFCWHFTHATARIHPLTYVPAFPPLSLLEEGHSGVALFMTLSGYLFAKLTDGWNVSVPRFLWNRFWRLAPLLAVTLPLTFLARVIAGEPPAGAALNFFAGLVLPRWPNGAWSIAVELQFYLLMPLLLPAICRRPHTAFVLVALALSIRTVLYGLTGEIQFTSYYSIVGRLDQFVLGIYCYILFRGSCRRGLVGLAAAAMFLLVLHAFNQRGGFYGTQTSGLWIVWTTLEGVFYGTIIAAYDNSRIVIARPLSAALSHIGRWSYSIYLWHFFLYVPLFIVLDRYVIEIVSYRDALLASVIAFGAMVAIGCLSYRTIEEPFFAKRRPYRLSPLTNGRSIPASVVG
jgi:peptidoglycan/LPS O-acetylase OafA/YrhL